MSQLHVSGSLAVGAFRLELDFQSAPGITVLFGPSASGKSLTLRAVAGLQPLGSGSLHFGDAPASSVAPGPAIRLGYVPQEGALWPHRRVREHLTPFTDLATATALAQRFLLQPLWERKPPALSGGERQRVALARAVARQPQVLLLDEPFTALDQPTREDLGRWVHDWATRSRAVVLWVTHDALEARRVADQLLVYSPAGSQRARAEPLTFLDALIHPPPAA